MVRIWFLHNSNNRHESIGQITWMAKRCSDLEGSILLQIKSFYKKFPRFLPKRVAETEQLQG